MAEIRVGLRCRTDCKFGTRIMIGRTVCSDLAARLTRIAHVSGCAADSDCARQSLGLRTSNSSRRFTGTPRLAPQSSGAAGRGFSAASGVSTTRSRLALRSASWDWPGRGRGGRAGPGPCAALCSGPGCPPIAGRRAARQAGLGAGAVLVLSTMDERRVYKTAAGAGSRCLRAAFRSNIFSLRKDRSAFCAALTAVGPALARTESAAIRKLRRD